MYWNSNIQNQFQYKDDPLFEEFLKVQAPNIAKDVLAKTQLENKPEQKHSSNDETDEEGSEDSSEADEEEKIADQNISDKEVN